MRKPFSSVSMGKMLIRKGSAFFWSVLKSFNLAAPLFLFLVFSEEYFSFVLC